MKLNGQNTGFFHRISIFKYVFFFLCRNRTTRQRKWPEHIVELLESQTGTIPSSSVVAVLSGWAPGYPSSKLYFWNKLEKWPGLCFGWRYCQLSCYPNFLRVSSVPLFYSYSRKWTWKYFTVVLFKNLFFCQVPEEYPVLNVVVFTYYF